MFNSFWKTIGDNIANYNTYPKIVGETGGKDFILAHQSANPKQVSTAITRGAFEFQGQKCSAASRGYISESIWNKVRGYLEDDLKSISMGSPENFENFVTSVIDEKSFDKISKYIDDANDSDSAEDYLKNRSKLERSGSTCIVVMVTPSHIICANTGDSRAILQRNGKVLPLSFDHKPNNIPELQRINNAGGFVKNRRVDGDLAVSRALGDFSYKKQDKLSTNKQKVIPEPEFVIYPRNFEQDEFMVLACDGVWDVATNQECSKFVQDYMDEGRNDLDAICEDALDTCLEKDSRDNMTMGLVTFDGAKYGSGSLGSWGIAKESLS